MKAAKFRWLLAILLICAVGAAMWGYVRHRRRSFDRQLDDTTNDVALLVDELDADQGVFDLADYRAVVSVQNLKNAAWTERQRQGAAILASEIGLLRACRAEKNLPGDQFDNCLISTQRLTDTAFDELER